MKREIQGRYVTISTVGEKAQALSARCHRVRPSTGRRSCAASSTRHYWRSVGWTASRPCFRTPRCSSTYVRKEAVLSSMIEGTQSSLSDLLLFELDQEPGVPIDDVRRSATMSLPSITACVCWGRPTAVATLVPRDSRGAAEQGAGQQPGPGRVPAQPELIGGTRPGNAAFVPPPAEEVLECMSKLELFLHDQPADPVLLKAALAHVQFETIHPFLDGNAVWGVC